MPHPIAYDKGYSFADFSANSPDLPLPGVQIDAELQNVETAIDSLNAALQDIRTSEGTLAPGIVTIASLASDFLTPVPRATPWATATAYVVDDAVYHSAKLYVCLVAHTSGTFATDLAALKWLLHNDFTPDGIATADTITFDPAFSGLAATDVQAAIDEVEARLGVEEAATVAVADLAADLLRRIMPIGVVLPFAGTVAPSGTLLSYGQNVSRSIYSALFSVIGTTFGAGDGSTTFTLPQMRGRVAAGKDDMGGTSANLLTGLAGGVNGDTLGAVGGVETHVLTAAQQAAHTHAISITSAAGGAHLHDLEIPSGGYSLAGAATVVAATGTNTAGNTTVAGAGIIALSATHTHAVTGTSASSGSSTAHNNIQPTIILNYIIITGVA